MEQGLIPANERVYELLALGTSLTQAIEGDSKSHSLHYVDWQHPERNVYHVTDEFPVQRPGSHETRRPDVVGFVNGIPLVVIECKRPDLGGETHRYLGRQCRLKVIASPDEVVTLERNYLYVRLPDPKRRQRVRELLDAWYLERARQVFA